MQQKPISKILLVPWVLPLFSVFDEWKDAFSDTFPHLLTNKFSTVLIAVGCWGCWLAADETIIQDVSQADNNQNWIISLCNGRKWCNSKVKSLNNYVNPQYPHTFNSFSPEFIMSSSAYLSIVSMDINVYIPHKTTSKYQTTCIILDTFYSGLMIPYNVGMIWLLSVSLESFLLWRSMGHSFFFFLVSAVNASNIFI